MNKKVMKLASSGKRFGAYCLDKIVPFILTCVILAVIAKLGSLTNAGSMYGYGYGYGYNFGGSAVGALGTIASVFVVIAIALAYVVVQIFFYTKSKTIGKAILGLQVISSVDGQPVGVFKMILREWFAKKASGSVLLLGYIWILIDDKKRGWHDKIMDTYVVDVVETARYNVNRNANDGMEHGSEDDRIESIIEEPVVDIVEENKEQEIQDVVNTNPEGGTTIE